ncbi:transposase [Mesorhizobium sp. WSM2561]|uniref:transposase n=1 Tax=Mesorhizobium sp. WSM2561 TaxID=1040985 RepID=UPI001FD916B7|nr:transposase [Mesorhizobium sp. WSM2561]
MLHSWGQNLTYHPHLHCIVPGGGISPDGTRWISCRSGFFFARARAVAPVSPPLSGGAASAS